MEKRQMSNVKSILCYGDSLTWGWVPVLEGAPTIRYPFQHRWTGVMAAALGTAYNVIEEGLSARTTCLDDPNDPRLNGSAYLPSALASHLPLDLVILMLGTNDTKSHFNRTPYQIANGMAKLVGQIASSAGGVGTTYEAPKILVVAPPPLAKMPHPFFEGMFEGGHEKTATFAKQFGAMADFMKVAFLDAGSVLSTDGCDGIHFTVENNLVLGTALAKKVKELLPA
jgi:lysophospholipase L1-like esterase